MNSSGNIEVVFRQFHKQLKRFIFSRVNDEAAADDILQEVFLKVHTNIEHLHDTSKLESWLYQITRNAIIDYYRSKKPSLPLPEEVPDDDRAETPAQKLSTSIHRFIEQLPESYREAIKLSEIDGIPQKEVAKKLGISLSGAKSRVQRGRKMLKDLLFECCHFEFDRSGGVIDYYPHVTTCCPVCRDE